MYRRQIKKPLQVAFSTQQRRSSSRSPLLISVFSVGLLGSLGLFLSQPSTKKFISDNVPGGREFVQNAEKTVENSQKEMEDMVKGVEKKTEFLDPAVVALKAASSKLFGFDPLGGEELGPSRKSGDVAVDNSHSLDVEPVVQMEEIKGGVLKSPEGIKQSPGTAKSPQDFNPMMKKSEVEDAGKIPEFKAKAEVDNIPVKDIVKPSEGKDAAKKELKETSNPKVKNNIQKKTEPSTKISDDIDQPPLREKLVLKEIPPELVPKLESTDVIKSEAGASNQPHDFNPMLKEGLAELGKLPEVHAKADLYKGGQGEFVKVEKEKPRPKGDGKGQGAAPSTPGKSKETKSKDSKPKDPPSKPPSPPAKPTSEEIKLAEASATAKAASVVHVDKNAGLTTILESILPHNPSLKPVIDHAINLVDNVKNEVEVLKKEFDDKIEEEQGFCKRLVEVMSKEYELTIEDINTQRKELQKLVEDAKNEMVKKEGEYKNEIAKRVDEERGGRLARLEYLQKKLGLLENGYANAMDFVERTVYLNGEMGVIQKLKDKMAKGVDVKKELEVLGKSGDKVSKVVLSSVSQSKVKTKEELERGFDRIYNDLYRAQFIPAQAGLVSLITGYALSFLLLPKQGLVPGKAPDCILSRAKFYITQGDIDSAAREVNQLQGWSGLLAHDWLENGRRYLELAQAVDVIETRLRLKQLNVLK